MTSLGVALSKPVSRRQESQSALSDPIGNALTAHGRAVGAWLGTLLSSTPWQSRTAPDLPRQQVLLLKLQQRRNRPSTPQFHLHTVLCPWPSKLLAQSIMKAWLSLIILATASHKLLVTAGRLHSSTNAYLLPSSVSAHLLFMALLVLTCTSSKTSHLRTKKLFLNFKILRDYTYLG